MGHHRNYGQIVVLHLIEIFHWIHCLNCCLDCWCLRKPSRKSFQLLEICPICLVVASQVISTLPRGLFISGNWELGKAHTAQVPTFKLLSMGRLTSGLSS